MDKAMCLGAFDGEQGFRTVCVFCDWMNNSISHSIRLYHPCDSIV